MKKLSLEQIIETKLNQEFTPYFLKIEDESYKHANHNPEARKGGTHFRVHMVAKKLKGMSRVQQHRWVYSVLEEELQQGVHALSLILKDSA